MTTTEPALRVFIVDDEPPARNRLRDLLNDCKDKLPLDIVGEAGNACRSGVAGYPHAANGRH
jgi:two-component system response regulator AlgR